MFQPENIRSNRRKMTSVWKRIRKFVEKNDIVYRRPPRGNGYEAI